MNVESAVLMIYEMTYQMPTVQLPEVEENMCGTLSGRSTAECERHTWGDVIRLCERGGARLFTCDDESS